ncbi:MAG: O-antigen ligase family protein [Prolixibacteraceae bacterium]|nr:O-antigen ligase family protein [Prolixibacteraceae bacterium]
MNVFEQKNGADNLRKPEIIGLFLLCTVLVAFVIAKWGIMSGLSIMLTPVLIFFISMIFLKPQVGIITLYTLNFFALGIYRYIGTIPWGLTVDFILVLTYLGLFFKSFSRPIPWSNAKNDLTLVAVIWYGYSILQLVNPEAGSRAAWFFAMRGVSFYMLLTIPLIFIIFNRPKDLRLYFLIWGIFSLLGSLKGLQQKFIGVDYFEQLWLDNGGAAQHMLFGKLRIFSFYSDAGQFGAAQGQAGVVFAILGLGEKQLKRRLFYFTVSILGLYGMMISGTRGAIAVPVMGIILYIILRKEKKAMLIGAAVLIAFFVFFKYTYIGQGNDTIRRMRTAFDPNDPSLQTRLENQRRLKVYMATRPFGGGLGATGGTGQKYNPGSFLASVPFDSWYVLIWMELGIIGLILHLSILFYILGKTSYIVMFRLKNESVKTTTIALSSGMFGIMVASYGNAVLGQMPTGVILYSGMAFMFLAPKHDEETTKAIESAKINQIQ